MKSLITVLVALLCLFISPATTIGGWPKPWEVSNEEMLINTGQPYFYGNKFNFGDSKIWKCTYNNGSGAAISISYPSPPQPPSRKPPTPSTPPPTPKMSPPPPQPSPPRPAPKKSPPPPKPSLPPPKPSPPRPTPKKSPPPPKPFLPPPKASPLIGQTPPTPKISSPPPKESTPSPSPPQESTQEPTTPSNPRNHYQNSNPWGHFISCMSDFGPSAICKQQMEVSYYTGRFRVSDYCCNLIVNMRNECTDVILGFYTDPFFVPLIRCTCHVKN